jgi:2-polyprenyl-3-methyl-5-hydroxy-6-metoxy-1,4-benzoquinol methylase
MTVYKTKKDLIEHKIKSTDSVLDVGFWGQGVGPTDPNWVHALLKERAREVWGLDIDFDESAVEPKDRYVRASAESFSFDKKFDVIFAGDLIEHLSNPGLFLQSARKHCADSGTLILTTPNCFNLFNIAEKFSKREPTVNHDHTCYFNSKTLSQLLGKNGWHVERVGFVYSLGVAYRESWKKKVLNALYRFLGFFTDQYMETLVVCAKKEL